MRFGRSCCKVFTVSLVPVTVFILSLLFLCGVVLLPTLYTELAYKQQYGIVVDAGSTHTHMYLYSWRVTSYNTTAQVHQVTSCRTEGGISSYKNATEVKKPIKNCLKGLRKHVPSAYRDNLYVWVGATAGMRLLKFENKNLSLEILRNVRHALGESNVGHNYRNVSIISGGEEGAAGWITANYLMKTLKKAYPRTRDLSVSSTGALDMGGASMQIAFEQQSVSNHTYSAVLFGEEWKLYSRSYLCYGVKEATRRLLAYLAKEENYNQSIVNPCLPKGNNLTHNMSFLFTNHTCTQDTVPEDSYNESTQISYIGSSDPKQCSELIERALNFSICFVNASIVNCSNDSVPDVTQMKFVAFSEFYYVAESYKNNSLNSKTLSLNSKTFSNFSAGVNDFCNKSWSKKNQTSIFKCFDGLYFIHTLKNGLGFAPKTGNWSITFKSLINNIETGWALGYMLNHTNNFGESPNEIVYPYSSTDLIVGILVLTILMVVFIVFFLFTFSACRKALRPIATGYTNIS